MESELALCQTRLWFVGMLVMSISMHYAGLLGAPRRTAEVAYLGAQTANAWAALHAARCGGRVLLFVSIRAFVIVAVGTLFANRQDRADGGGVCTPAGGDPTPPGFLQHLYRWGVRRSYLAGSPIQGRWAS